VLATATVDESWCIIGCCCTTSCGSSGAATLVGIVGAAAGSLGAVAFLLRAIGMRLISFLSRARSGLEVAMVMRS
jgi:hypothetical protein